MPPHLIEQLCRIEAAQSSRVNLTPSENVLSPLARLPFVLDAHGRYFLDDLRLFGRWFFPAGRELGALQHDVLTPILQTMTEARHVNIRPISGINCMTAALAGIARSGDTVLTVPLSAGGHASTSVVATRLGLRVEPLPFTTPHDLDLDRLADMLERESPALIYFDQSTLLFPIDPEPVRRIVDIVSPSTLIHYDSSHVNGLILGGAVFNPLRRGADSFGGSTHKTLAGPHKGFFATNRDDLAERFQAATDHFVSHHHMASVLSLAITLIEMQECGGAEYARTTVDNARLFAVALANEGVPAAEGERGYTSCHQVWVPCDTVEATAALTNRLERCGLLANNFNCLPGLDRPGFRLSAAEITKRGASSDDMVELAGVIADAVLERAGDDDIRGRVADLAGRWAEPRYCFGWKDIEDIAMPARVRAISRGLFGE